MPTFSAPASPRFPFSDSYKVSRFLDYADFCGMQPTLPGQPSLELWTLRKAIPGHPRGSTVVRSTLERALFLGPPAPFRGKYCATVPDVSDQALQAVESPAMAL